MNLIKTDKNKWFWLLKEGKYTGISVSYKTKDEAIKKMIKGKLLFISCSFEMQGIIKKGSTI